MYRIRDPFKGDVGFECEGNIYIYMYMLGVSCCTCTHIYMYIYISGVASR